MRQLAEALRGSPKTHYRISMEKADTPVHGARPGFQASSAMIYHRKATAGSPIRPTAGGDRRGLLTLPQESTRHIASCSRSMRRVLTKAHPELGPQGRAGGALTSRAGRRGGWRRSASSMSTRHVRLVMWAGSTHRHASPAGMLGADGLQDVCSTSRTDRC